VVNDFLPFESPAFDGQTATVEQSVDELCMVDYFIVATE
jgi:hypothetical protein